MQTTPTPYTMTYQQGEWSLILDLSFPAIRTALLLGASLELLMDDFLRIGKSEVANLEGLGMTREGALEQLNEGATWAILNYSAQA